MEQAERIEPGSEICFDTGVLEVDVQTKVTAVTMDNIESFNVIATTGSGGSETLSWSVTATKDESVSSGTRYKTGRYWPQTNPSYHFYASNANITMESGAPIVAVDGGTDVVVARTRTPSYPSPTNPLAFSHIYSRVGNVSISSTKGYDVSGVSVSLENAVTGGKYNIYSSAWTDTATSTISVQIGENDVYIAPGQCSVSVTYTLTKGDYSNEFTQTGSVTFPVNKICNLAINLTSDPAVPISFNVSMSDWETNEIPFNLS